MGVREEKNRRHELKEKNIKRKPTRQGILTDNLIFVLLDYRRQDCLYIFFNIFFYDYFIFTSQYNNKRTDQILGRGAHAFLHSIKTVFNW